MTKEQQQKLQEYLNYYLNLSDQGIFEFATILYADKYDKDIKSELKSNKITFIKAEKHEDEYLRKIFNALKEGKPAAIELTEIDSNKFRNHLENIASNLVNAQLAGDNQTISFKPLDTNGRLILLVNKEKLDYLPYQSIITSVCNIK